MLISSTNIKHVKVPVVYGFMGRLIHSLITLVITGFILSAVYFLFYNESIV